MKILVIFTGGTIGSSEKEGFISPDQEKSYFLINKYESVFGKKAVFETKEPYFILSENLSAKEMNLLISEVVNAAEKDFDGIIVTHGTDTLQFSAAALSYALGSESIPVLLVSANYPLNDPRSNGFSNFAGAVEFILQKKGKGVFVSYQNENQPLFFHRGGKLLSHKEGDDALFSDKNQIYAVLSEKGEIEVLFAESGERIWPFSLCSDPSILVVESFPSAQFNFDLSKVKCVILRPYHSGTVNTASSVFISFCNKAKNKNIPLFLVNGKEGACYESTKAYCDLGIKPVSKSFVACFIRLWIALSRREDLNLVFK